MADKKKRICPNIAKGQDGKPLCGKEFDFDPDDWNGRCTHCGFPVNRYDDEARLSAVRAEEQAVADAAEKDKDKGKRKSRLGNLGDL